MTPHAAVAGDEPLSYPVRAARTVFSGRVWEVRSEDVDLGAAGVVTREYIAHPGAVAIAALDEADRVLLVRQYRHPARHLMWELPAGLRDIPGEPPQVTAERELWEETHHRAGHYELLLDTFLSPGSSSERLLVFLARDVRLADGDRHEGEAEEATMQTAWVPLDELTRGVLEGRFHNPSLTLGVLALAARRGGA
ncbi:MAG TPA: NUDIX hydrolase [Actinomycetes bacterium]|nr:NUDIX hydrolase [Actinomycetes bacterium]